MTFRFAGEWILTMLMPLNCKKQVKVHLSQYAILFSTHTVIAPVSSESLYIVGGVRRQLLPRNQAIVGRIFFKEFPELLQAYVYKSSRNVHGTMN